MRQSIDILQKIWKYPAFRPMQEEIVDAAIYGNDVLALLPTGGGKSICFQVPGLAREGTTIVISPLIALMEDQVTQLQKRGIRAKAITSAMSYREMDITLDNARFGSIDFLYVSPERLSTSLFIERVKLMKIGLLVVDEAHCISEWGHDFRPSYRKIHLLRELCPGAPMMAVTATATPKVKEDIVLQLHLKDPSIFEAPFVRPNISYEVYQVPNKYKAIRRVIGYFPNQSGIIYCQKRKSVKQLAQHLLSYNVNVGIYHGGMNNKDRSEMLQAWMDNRFHIMVATNAFGMGIDKPDVRFVAHYEFPDNPEALFQEAGRAGRDGLPARTFVFYNSTEFEQMDMQLREQFPPIDEIKNCYQLIGNFLKIAVGAGAEESYSFDLKKFVETYQLNYMTTYHCIRFLELNNYLTFSESVFHPTKIKILVNNATLYNFQIQQDSIVPLTTYLTRTFAGIFDEYMDIHEEKTIQRLKISSPELKRQLQLLEQRGIIDVSWKSDLPQVYFNTERLPKENLRISDELYVKRKQVVIERWKLMKEYLQEDQQCRAQFLVAYFGQTIDKCGKCDVCLREKKQFDTKQAQQIILENSEGGISIEEIYAKFDIQHRKEVVAVLRYLLKEERIVEKNNVLIRKK